MLTQGFISMTDYNSGGWVTDLKYLDEVEDIIKTRQKVADNKSMKEVKLRQYSSVSKSVFGLTGGSMIAVIRASGAIAGVTFVMFRFGRCWHGFFVISPCSKLLIFSAAFGCK